jgi:hypothetical protein
MQFHYTEATERIVHLSSCYASISSILHLTLARGDLMGVLH